MTSKITSTWRCDCCDANAQTDSAQAPSGWVQNFQFPDNVQAARVASAARNALNTVPPAATGDLCGTCAPAPDWSRRLTVSTSDVCIPRPVGLPESIQRYIGLSIPHKSCGKSFTADFDAIQREVICPNCGAAADIPAQYWNVA